METYRRVVINCLRRLTTPLRSLLTRTPALGEGAHNFNPHRVDLTRPISIQNLVQFDSDHVLDVHQARLYPFDNYLLTSTIRAVSHSNETLPIRKLAAIDVTSSFNIFVTDTDSYSTSANGTEIPSRDMDMRITRPSSARAFALLLFGIAWVLTHVTIGLVIVSRTFTDARPKVKILALSALILVAIPQLRNSMPDAPGLDGKLHCHPLNSLFTFMFHRRLNWYV